MKMFLQQNLLTIDAPIVKRCSKHSLPQRICEQSCLFVQRNRNQNFDLYQIEKKKQLTCFNLRFSRKRNEQVA